MRTVRVFLALAVAASVCNAQWYWQNPLPCGNSLNDVCFVDANIGIAVGDLGTIVKTTAWAFRFFTDWITILHH